MAESEHRPPAAARRADHRTDDAEGVDHLQLVHPVHGAGDELDGRHEPVVGRTPGELDERQPGKVGGARFEARRGTPGRPRTATRRSAAIPGNPAGTGRRTCRSSDAGIGLRRRGRACRGWPRRQAESRRPVVYSSAVSCDRAARQLGLHCEHVLLAARIPGAAPSPARAVALLPAQPVGEDSAPLAGAPAEPAGQPGERPPPGSASGRESAATCSASGTRPASAGAAASSNPSARGRAERSAPRSALGEAPQQLQGGLGGTRSAGMRAASASIRASRNTIVDQIDRRRTCAPQPRRRRTSAPSRPC